jgi:hypothetical protein
VRSADEAIRRCVQLLWRRKSSGLTVVEGHHIVKPHDAVVEPSQWLIQSKTAGAGARLPSAP